MEYKTYLARKRLKKLVICGHVNIPYSKAKAENRIKLRKQYGPEIYNDTKEM